MPFTTPGTATAGDVLTASFWNTNVRDNLNDLRMAPIASYVWTNWNPTNNTGTNTNAPATSVSDIANATYLSQSNSSGTLTVTCKIAGYYKVTAGMTLTAANVFTIFRGSIAFGGTSTLYAPTAVSSFRIVAEPSTDQDTTQAGSYILLATANQTLTILPSGNVTAGLAVSNYTLASWSMVEFMGATLV